MRIPEDLKHNDDVEQSIMWKRFPNTAGEILEFQIFLKNQNAKPSSIATIEQNSANFFAKSASSLKQSDLKSIVVE